MWQKISERGWYPEVAGQTITYRKSLQPVQKFDLYTRLVGYDGLWVYVEQTFRVGGRSMRTPWCGHASSSAQAAPSTR